MRIKTSSLLLLSLTATGTFGVLHYAHALELQYPNLPGFGVLTASTNTIPQIFQFFFAFALWFAGIILLGNIAYVGFLYMTSWANPGQHGNALKRLAGIILGAGMLLGTFVILQTINPELISPENFTLGICGTPGLPACPSLTLPTVHCAPPGSTPPGYACPANLICQSDGTCGSGSGSSSGGPPGPACSTCGSSGAICCKTTDSCTPGGSPAGSQCAPGLSCQGDNTCGGGGGPAPNSFTFFCQADSQWGSIAYGSDTIAGSGCGPTSIAMILSTSGMTCNGVKCTPDAVVSMIHSNEIPGVSDNGDGTSITGAIILPGLKTESIAISGGYPSITQMTNEFSQHPGALIIAGSPNFPCNNVKGYPPGTVPPGGCSHIFVVDGATGDGTVDVRDPSNCPYGDGSSEGLGGAPGPRALSSTSFQWFYAYVFHS